MCISNSVLQNICPKREKVRENNECRTAFVIQIKYINLYYQLVVNMGEIFASKGKRSEKITSAVRHSLFSRTLPFFGKYTYFPILTTS